MSQIYCLGDQKNGKFTCKVAFKYPFSVTLCILPPSSHVISTLSPLDIVILYQDILSSQVASKLLYEICMYLSFLNIRKNC